MWAWKKDKYKNHIPHKKQKETKIEESYICIESFKSIIEMQP